MKILFLLTVVVVAGVAMAFTQTKTVAIGPHEPIDLKGRLRIDGEKPEPAHGHLFLVGVSEVRVSLLQKLVLSLDPEITLQDAPLPTEVHITDQRDKDAILESKKIAAAAAYTLLGRPVRITGGGAFVNMVDSEGPASGRLKGGDRITLLNGRLVDTSLDVTRIIGSSPPGTRLEIGFRRGNLPFTISLRTTTPLKGDRLHTSRIGVGLTTPRLRIGLPRRISLDTAKVVGPSAGLAFALAVYDAESSVDLLRGRYIVATGALTLEGEVLRVGGVRQKAISTQSKEYDLLITPRGNVDEAVEAIRDVCDPEAECVRVLGVDSVAQAVEYLKLGSRDLEPKLAN